MGLFIDERADKRQRQALQTIFAGQAGGWPAGFAATIGEFRGVDFVPISEIADDLAYWQAEIPGRVHGRAEALTGRTTPPGKRVQTINPPGSEVGPGQVATWSRSDGGQSPVRRRPCKHARPPLQKTLQTIRLGTSPSFRRMGIGVVVLFGWWFGRGQQL